jgi:hypothetical protein
MVKKYILIVSLTLPIFSTAYAQTLTKSEKDFNDQVMHVMHVMQNIENKSIDQTHIDAYLNQANVSPEVKRAVKSNIERHIHYSDYHKVEDGIYFCNKADQFHAQCNYYGYERGFQCAYTSQQIMCHTIPSHPGPDKSTCKP